MDMIRVGRMRHACMVALLALACVFMVALPTAAHAEGSTAFDGGDASESFVFPDQATGNVFAIDHSINGMAADSDFYWAGSDLKATGVEAGASGSGDILIAGNDISLLRSSAAGSVRMAGNEVVLSQVTAANNFTLAGSAVEIGAGSVARGVYAAGSTVDFAGECSGAVLYGGRVTISGTVNGDVTAYAGTVEVLPGAVITGSLTVPPDADVTVADGATVGALEKSDALKDATDGFSFADAAIPWGAMMAFGLLAHALLAALFISVARGPFERMAIVTRDRMGWVALFGVVAVMAGPLAALLLLLPVVTAPISVLLMIVMVTVFLFAIPLAGCAVGMRLGGGGHAYGMAIAFTSIFTAIAYFPVVSLQVPVALACTMYVVGCWIQMAWLKHLAN